MRNLIGLGLTAIALLMPGQAIAQQTRGIAQQTRGEAYLEYLWANLPHGSGIYELGALNDLGFQQASQTLLNQGVEWCDRANNPSVLQASMLGSYGAIAQDPDNANAQVDMYVIYASAVYLCPEQFEVFDRIGTGVINSLL